MKKWLILLVALLSLLSSSGLGVMTLRSHINRGPVYRVGAVLTGLAHHPQAWIHRTLLVRGLAVATTCVVHTSGALCGIPRLGLSDPGPAAALDWLDLTWAGSDPLLAFLRRVPLVATVVPAPQVIHWGVVAVYRVQLRAEGQCGSACYEALLLDAAP